MLVLDKERFRHALKEKGYHSIQELAETIGVHRNTLQYYLSERPLLPEPLVKAFKSLDLAASDVLIDKKEDESAPDDVIAPLIDPLHAEFPGVTIVLFGSRTQKRAHKYSDWDIGVFSGGGLSHSDYLKIRKRAGDMAEDLPYFVDLVNLNRADGPFLAAISRSWRFLTGKLGDWAELQRRAKNEEAS